MPTFVPPAKPRFAPARAITSHGIPSPWPTRHIQCSSAQASSCATESSSEPLSTTTTWLGAGSASSSVLMHAIVSAGLFQLTMTTPNVGALDGTSGDWSLYSGNGFFRRRGRHGGRSRCSLRPAQARRRQLMPERSHGSSHILIRIRIPFFPIGHNRGASCQEDSCKRAEEDCGNPHQAVARPLRLSRYDRGIDDGNERRVIDLVDSRDLELAVEIDVKIRSEVDVTFDSLFFELETRCHDEPAVLLVEQALTLLGVAERGLCTIVSHLQKSALRFCARDPCLLVEGAHEIDQTI